VPQGEGRHSDHASVDEGVAARHRAGRDRQAHANRRQQHRRDLKARQTLERPEAGRERPGRRKQRHAALARRKPKRQRQHDARRAIKRGQRLDVAPAVRQRAPRVALSAALGDYRALVHQPGHIALTRHRR
jgi:hypothetical protein